MRDDCIPASRDWLGFCSGNSFRCVEPLLADGPEVAANAMKDLDLGGVVEGLNSPLRCGKPFGALKSIHRRVSLSDCFAIALANQLGATVLTADHHEFDELARQGVCSVRFIR